MNPRAATNDLLPFQGSPFNHLGTSASTVEFYLIQLLVYRFKSGESGIRTHAPLRTNGFQDRLVMTTSISLQTCLSIISDVFKFVKNFLKLFSKLFLSGFFSGPLFKRLGYIIMYPPICQRLFPLFFNFF